MRIEDGGSKRGDQRCKIESLVPLTLYHPLSLVFGPVLAAPATRTTFSTTHGMRAIEEARS
jgi:hypothetical protein